MQGPLYRNDVTHRSMGCPHVPLPSYYLGMPVIAASSSRAPLTNSSRHAQRAARGRA